MLAHYYSQRRLSPYRGTWHVIDVGQAYACTEDGVHWRARDRRGVCRSSLQRAWMDFTEAGALRTVPELAAAFVGRPPLPFPPADRVELWLLDKAKMRPLALTQTRRGVDGIGAMRDCSWLPLPMEERQFRAQCLQARDAARPPGAWPVAHVDVLDRQVNAAARPYPAAQWFIRQPDGSGRGLDGTRVPRELVGRTLERPAFPELLVREDWEDETECTLAREYHEWVAPWLLTHRGLSVAARRRLERAACRRPIELMNIFRLIPEFVDRAVLDLALVEARLMTHVLCQGRPR